MSINPILTSGYAAAASSASGSTKPAGSTPTSTSDNFMTMLMAQLRNQNPMEPMQDRELITQVTLLNSLQELQKIQTQMEQLATANQASYASSLIGKTIKAQLPDGKTVEGVVTGATMTNGAFSLNVGDKTVPLTAVTSIQEAKAA